MLRKVETLSYQNYNKQKGRSSCVTTNSWKEGMMKININRGDNMHEIEPPETCSGSPSLQLSISMKKILNVKKGNASSPCDLQVIEVINK